MTAITFLEQRAIEDRGIRQEWSYMIFDTLATVAKLLLKAATVVEKCQMEEMIIPDGSPRSSMSRCSRNVMAVICWHHHADPARVGILTAGIG